MHDIILLHGALGSSGDLETLSASLTELGYRIFSLTFTGHGGKNPGPSFGILQFKSELNELIRDNNLFQATIFGYSMGGYVALLNAALDQQFTGKILTLGTKFDWSEKTVEKETRLLDPWKIEEKVPDLAQKLHNKHGNTWRELVVKTAGLMKETGEKQFLNKETFGTIQNPVLICRGENDSMVTEEESVTASQQIPNGIFYSIPGVKHQLESISEEILARIIHRFILNNKQDEN